MKSKMQAKARLGLFRCVDVFKVVDWCWGIGVAICLGVLWPPPVRSSLVHSTVSSVSAQEPETHVYFPLVVTRAEGSHTSGTPTTTGPPPVSRPPTATPTITTRFAQPDHDQFVGCIIFESYMTGSQSRPRLMSKTTYNDLGRVERWESFSDSTSVDLRREYEYRDQWQVLSARLYRGTSNNNLSGRMWWNYNEREQLIRRVVDSDADGMADVEWIFEYDDLGRLNREITPSDVIVYEYDGSGHRVRDLVDIDMNGTPDFGIHYSWRDDLIVNVGLDRNGDGVVDLEGAQEYDQVGRIIRSDNPLLGEEAIEYHEGEHFPHTVRQFRDGELEEVTKYEYDAAGRWIEVSWNNVHGETWTRRFENLCP